MAESGIYTQEEIFSQPEAWQAALEVLNNHRQEIISFFQKRRYEQVIFTGCGSTYYLALSAAALFQELSGFPGRAFPASELWLYPRSSYPQKSRVLLIAVSRSGATTETLRACEAFKASGRGELVTLSCYDDQPLASLGNLNLVLPSGAERSVAQTRAFSTLYLAAIALAALWYEPAGLYPELERLPDVCCRILERDADLLRGLGRERSLERFYFLGSGPRYGLACELSLKMKEMSLSHSEPFHFLEFRHGPQSMVTGETLVVGLVSQHNRKPELAVLDEMRTRGARILNIGDRVADVLLEAKLSEVASNLLYLPAGQLLAFERSLDRGLDPDTPHGLSAVVELVDVDVPG